LHVQCNYWTATQKALNAIASGTKLSQIDLSKAKWRVMRSHETPYNIEGDPASGTIADVLVPALVAAGIRINIGSHFHVGAFMVTDLSGTVTPPSTGPGGKSNVYYDASSKTYKDVTSAPNIANDTKWKIGSKTATEGAFLQFVIGHSGRNLDDLVNKTTKAVIMWARGKPSSGSGKYGFAVFDFGDTSMTAKFYDDDGTLECQVTVGNTRRRMKKMKMKKRAAKRMKKHMKKRNRRLRKK
jgi:hypothetical protein